MKNVHTLAPDAKNKQISKKLTEKQWSVYYYIMSICHWNSRDKENHYFFYKKELNISHASKLLGISRPTIHTSLKKLIEMNILQECEDYYLVQIPKIYAEINQRILSKLIPYQVILGVDLIRTYAVLCRIDQMSSTKIFTKAAIIDILGHSIDKGSMYYKMELYLAFLSYEKFIDITFKTKTKCGKKYKEFLLKGINTDNIELEEDEIEVIDADLFDKIKERIKEEGIWEIE